MTRVLPRTTIATAAAALLLATACPADEKKAGAGSFKSSDPKEQAAGVIVKVEKLGRGSGSSKAEDRDNRHFRLTINTAAVWRDWARDQDKENPAEPKRRAVDEGKNSVATKGQPKAPETLVVVDLQPITRVETRFRAMSDEAGRGTANPPDERPARKGPRKTAKPTRFALEDLKEGLFVEVDFQHLDAKNPASKVTVMRPLDDAAVDAAEKAPQR